MRRRARALAYTCVGVAALFALVMAVVVTGCVSMLSKLDVTVDDKYVTTELSDGQARADLARYFHLHIPDNWPLVRMTTICNVGTTLNTCSYRGSFSGPAAEFDRYPTVFRAQPPETADQPAARPVTCADLAARSLLGVASELGIDCAASQQLLLSELRAARTVLITGTDTAVTVHVRAMV
ncbi:hypothetical protein [Nocardia sp. NPDC056000]|uniref:hypothetical protein n=1 Tax=Nocardia sp. NPDC056000 TaxID=3345674 RepID=UPI0035D5A693